MEKTTLEQFGAKIRLKYPEYAKYSNVEIAQRTIQKYPQYAQNISDLPEDKPKNLAEKIGFTNTKVGRAGQAVYDFFAGETSKFGQSTGQTLGFNKAVDPLIQADTQASDIQLNLQKRINTKKALGQDTTRLEQELTNLSGRESISKQITDTTPVLNKSNKQVGGEALGTFLEATGVGALKGVKGFGLASRVAETADDAAKARKLFLAKSLGGRLKQIGIETAKDVATVLPFGYSFDVAQNLLEDKSGAEIFKPGMGSLVSSIIPLGIGTVRATRQVTADLLSNVVAPNLSGVQSEAYKRLRTGEVNKYIGKETPQTVLDEARTSASAFKSTMQREFGKGKEDIITEFTGKRIGIDEASGTKLKKIAERFGFDDRLPSNVQQMSAKETMDLLEEINSVSKITDIDDPLVKSLKLGLAEIKDDIKTRAIKEFGGAGGSFDNIYKTYSSKKTTLNNIQKIIGEVGLTPNSIKLDPIKRKTAVSRLQAVFRENADSYLDAIKALEDETGTVILDRVAASQLGSVLPKTLRTAPVGTGGVINDAISLATFPLSSPRIGTWLINKIGGYGPGIAESLLNAVPSVRKAIYDAVTKENMAFDDAVKFYAREYLENPRVGLSLKDVSKELADAGYKETGELTTKILKDLEGKTTVSKQYILDATNRGELKQVERDITRMVLDGMPDGQINVQEFADKVKSELLPLKVKDTVMSQKEARRALKKAGYDFEQDMSGGANIIDKNGEYVDYLDLPTNIQEIADSAMGTAETYNQIGKAKYESIALPDELRGNVKNYKENIYESPIATSAGEVHWRRGEHPNYFGHTRIEDMADNKTRRVIEVQSDLYQKGNLEREGPKIDSLTRQEFEKGMTPEEVDRYREAYRVNKEEYTVPLSSADANPNYKAKIMSSRKTIDELENKAYPIVTKARQAEVSKLQQYNDPTAHFRMVREEIKKAAKDGKAKLQFPTGETAIKIEGLGEAHVWHDIMTGDKPTINSLKVGQRLEQGIGPRGEEWIITDVLGDGKFKAVPKREIEMQVSNNKTLYDKANKWGYIKDDADVDVDGIMKDEVLFPQVLKEAEGMTESFDISGKVDTNNPIYKFYEKDVQKYLNKFGGKKVVDDKGVSWIEVPLKKEWGDIPVEAFAGFGVIGSLFKGKDKKEEKKPEVKKELPVFKTYKDGNKVFSLDEKTQVSEIHPKIKSAIDETYKSYPELPKGVIEALLMKESSAGYDDTNRNPKIGKYAWIGGLTEIAKKELVRNGYTPDFDTIGGALNSMAKFWLIKSKEGMSPADVYDKEYSSGKLKKEDLAKFQKMFDYYSKING